MSILALTATCGYAQIGAQIVSDPPVETATTDMDTVQEPGILVQDTATATSVTTGEGSPSYTPINNYLAGLTSEVAGGVNLADYPGWEPLPTDSSVVAQKVTGDTMATYQAAIREVSGAPEADAVFSQIEQVSSSTTNLLAAVQANTDAVIAVGQQIAMERATLQTLIAVETTKAMEELNERGRELASEQKDDAGWGE